MDRPKKRSGSSSPPESHAGSRQSTSTEREVRSSPQAQSASALGRARKRQGHSCARELVAGSGEPTSTAREARPSPPAPSAAVLADRLGHNGIILLLFETPSGFAIFKYYGVQLFLPNAKENIWSKFINNDKTRLFIWLKEFRTFNDKSKVINHTGISTHLTEMIKKWHLPGQKLAVGKLEYKKAIEARLKIPCLFNDEVLEVMWGLKNLMRSLIPEETSELTEEDRLQMSYGMKTVLDRYGFHDFKPEMVNERIIETAGILHDCDLCLKKHSNFFRSHEHLLLEVSQIDTQGWGSWKLATAIRIVCCPYVTTTEYEEILKRTCLRMYGEMIRGHNMKADALEHMKLLVREAKEAYEAEQAKKAYEAEQATKTLEADQGEKPVHPHKSTERRVPDTEAAIQEIKEEVVNGVPGNPHKSPEGGVLDTEAPIQEDKNVVNGPPGNPHKLPKGGVLDTGAVVQEIKKEVLSGPPLDPHKLPEGRGLDTGAVIQEIKKEVVNGAPGGGCT
ncbi:uncharacterized protein LOC120680550 isoform X4 [Panicum virgatum]|uniref:Uncharacterized protein n=1 Tax=Panicum virgatum TaxID=38727 RepID=A0A8T0QF09_PANVG|nr:uncharacterized protein LOC120680550 isoform X4 [Panicum virgatum]KAG2569346.1 hypothetical protein PVAP13_7NG383300 [Panicum virgatum]